MSLVKVLCAFHLKHDVTCFFSKDMLFRRRVLQRAEKVTSEFVLEHHNYYEASALYSYISNKLRHLDQVSI
jgi:hypothetical protein